VLGHHLALIGKHSRYEVVKTIENALESRSTPAAFTIPSLGCHTQDGFASQRQPQPAYTAWDPFRLIMPTRISPVAARALAVFVRRQLLRVWHRSLLAATDRIEGLSALGCWKGGAHISAKWNYDGAQSRMRNSTERPRGSMERG
jgi:hypothetical protein